MTAAGPWSVKGIDPKAREIAKDLARRSGLTLGEWLNQMIIDGGDIDAPAVSPPEPAPEARRRPLEELYREARNVRPAGPQPQLQDSAEVGRVVRTLNDLALRMEAAEQRSGLAISGVDQSVLGVLSRLDAIEREHGTANARALGAAADVRNAQAHVADKLQELAREDSARVEALKSLEAALGRVAERMQAGEARGETLAGDVRQVEERLSDRLQAVEEAAARAPDAYADAEKVDVVLTRMAERLDQAETRTTAAVQSLQSTFAGLDSRLRTAESRSAASDGAEIEGRFQTLAQELSRRVESTRQELAERLRSATDGRLEGMDAALREMRGHIDQTEQRSAQAIDRIGREVIRVAHGLGERVGGLETGHQASRAELDGRLADIDARVAEADARNSAAVEAVGGEVARIADAMEAHTRNVDTAQADALEKLGDEIARIAERLAERISNSDRRAAEAIDEVTDRVGKLGEQMDARQERSATDLADRIRQSEERTAKLLDDARERLERTLTARAPEPPRAFEAPASFATAPPHPSPAAASASVASNADPFGLPPDEADSFMFEPEPPPVAPAKVAPAAAYAPPLAVAPPPVRVEPPAADFTADDFLRHNDPFADRDFGHDDGSPFDPEDDFVHVAPAAAEPRSAPAAEAFAFTAATPSPSFPQLTPEPAFEAPAAFGEVATFEPEPPAFAAPTSGLGQPQGAPIEEPLFGGVSVTDFAPAPETQPGPTQMSTREMLQAARQAAQTAAGRPEASADKAKGGGRAPKPFGLTLPGRRKKDAAPTLRTMALASVTAGAITTAAVGAYMLGGASHDGGADSAHAPDIAAANAPAATPNLAVALTPTAVDDHALTIPAQKSTAVVAPAKSAATLPDHEKPVVAAPPIKSAHAIYTSAVSRLESGDLTAVGDLKSAANQGDVAAQFYLARLYEAGGAGLPKDLTEARRWTERAAEGGDPMAMYNLASYAYAGDGGAKDVQTAVTWFRRAAEHGVVNGQYNLAQLYEKGYGVSQDLGQAYVWYSAAADAGDPGAKAAAAALRARLSPTVVAEADKQLASLRIQLAEGRGATVKTAAAKPVP